MSCDYPFQLFNYAFTNSCSDVYGTLPPPMEWSVALYALFFGFTLLFETPVYVHFLKKQLGLKRAVFASLVLNLATHPLVCIVFSGWFNRQGFSYSKYLYFSEIFAPVVEAVLLVKIFHQSSKRAAIASLTANLTSWIIGGTIFVMVFF